MVIDQKLAFNENVDHVYKEAQQQLFLLRKLTSLNVGPHILESGYRSLIKKVFLASTLLRGMVSSLSRTGQD